MLRKINRKSLRTSLQLLLAIAAALLVWGCGGGGGDSYDAPELFKTAPIEGQTQNVLIDAPTLKKWLDEGYVNNSDSYENVVILHNSGYANGHIPGAQEWSTNGTERVEGPILSGNMVLDGEMMDQMCQERGIHENSTIVFTGGNNTARIYFMFRYWGFPKEQLKILNGDMPAWTAYGYELTTVSPTVAATDFSVKNLPATRDDLRASLSEAIIGVEQGTVTPYNTYAATSDITEPKIKETIRDAEDFVIFQGLMNGAVTDNFNAGLKKTIDINGTDVTVFKSVDEMLEWLESLAVDLNKPVMTYCRAGNLASQGFAPLDAVLGGNQIDVMMYDGSWSQWGSLTNFIDVPEPKFALPAGYEEWATDVLTDPIYYNYNGTEELSVPEWHQAPLSPYDAGANSIEIEDREYLEAPPEGGAPTSGSGGSGGGC